MGIPLDPAVCTALRDFFDCVRHRHTFHLQKWPIRVHEHFHQRRSTNNMTRTVALSTAVTAFTISLAAAAPPGPAKSATTPFEWGTATPASQGFVPEKLEALKNELAARATDSFVVIRNDKIVYEWYAEGWNRTKPHGTASMAKALVGGETLAVAITDKKIGLDDLAYKYIPQWKNDPRKNKITIRQLGSHSSGIDDSTVPKTPATTAAHTALPGWMGEWWKASMEPGRDAFTLSRDVAPMIYDPGTSSKYSNPGIGMMGYAVTVAMGKDLRTILRERIMTPIGIPEEEWSVGYGGKTWKVDGVDQVPVWGGGKYSVNASARVARLMLRKGDWQGKRLLDAKAVDAVTADAGFPGVWAQGWWSAKEQGGRGAPPDAFFAVGAGGQVVLVAPSLNVIAVRNGNEPPLQGKITTLVIRGVMEALVTKPRKASAP
jgi:CubicO group peptidase (beta-lactamase class C family)